ncbi:hypothetical protein [Pararhizobium antarcticum]|uniref:Uncharacterized protein n=1 Tax=Pararhizobium antarcticum TaxID=1798805 RepID=A0A657LNB1_9HYPH|nr:hypothetical protein [Pararhizobium antarcticum]OJF91288.1 hypothetical protein AX760_07145 [Pararhizobium antarcticum]OJG01195.1 hypothetical protein AX761_00850 [Rhizobium sp. 58]
MSDSGIEARATDGPRTSGLNHRAGDQMDHVIGWPRHNARLDDRAGEAGIAHVFGDLKTEAVSAASGCVFISVF